MSASRPPTDPATEAFWHEFLTRGDSRERRFRRLFKHLPHEPRCRMCAAPFGGAFAPVMRLLGRHQAQATPNWCNACIAFATEHHGGAEVEMSFLLADIRGSTTLAEAMSPSDFHALLDRFYATASGVVYEHDGYVDKFVGDELVAMFFPLLTGERYPARAVEAALGLLRATGHADAAGPWVPVGAGVHTGAAWFGAIGEGTHVELTAVGDAVNTTARLASMAGAGEVLVTGEAAKAAGLDPTLERRTVPIRGRAAPMEVVSLRVGR
jgi:adenylate cyclase